MAEHMAELWPQIMLRRRRSQRASSCIPSQTLTLSDQNFLKGEADGKPTTLSAEFRIAQGSGRLPTVVLMHGSGGMGPNIAMWSNELNAMGISTFAIDGFTGRGLTSVSTNQALLGRLNFILDIYRALDVLAQHPRVDPARIALMGFSARRPSGALRESETLQQNVEQIGHRICRLFAVLS